MKNFQIKKPVTVAVYVAILIVVVYLTSIFLDIDRKDSLKDNWVVTDGKLNRVKLMGKSADFAEYVYDVDNMNFSGEYFNEVQNIHDQFEDFKRYTWVVIYDSTNYSNSALLLRREDFDKWGIPYTGQKVADFN